MKGNEGKREHTVVSYSKKPTSLLDRAWRISTATTTREAAAAAGELLDQGAEQGQGTLCKGHKGEGNVSFTHFCLPCKLCAKE